MHTHAQDFMKMHSTARSFDIVDDDRFCDVVKVKPPHNITEASIIVSTANITVETTVVSDKFQLKNQHVWLMYILGVRCSVSKNGTLTYPYPF
jgi:hypothetical protein